MTKEKTVYKTTKDGAAVRKEAPPEACRVADKNMKYKNLVIMRPENVDNPKRVQYTEITAISLQSRR